MEASGEQFIKDEVDAIPPAASSATASTAGISAPDAASLWEAFGVGGTSHSAKISSNAVAIGSQDTAAGDGLLLYNPHFPWEGPDRLWVAQLTVPGQYDEEGSTVAGIPLVLFGFNQDVAWTHTSSTDFHFTLYQLKLVPGDPTSYLVDGQRHKMTSQTVVVDTGHHHTVRPSGDRSSTSPFPATPLATTGPPRRLMPWTTR